MVAIDDKREVVCARQVQIQLDLRCVVTQASDGVCFGVDFHAQVGLAVVGDIVADASASQMDGFAVIAANFFKLSTFNFATPEHFAIINLASGSNFTEFRSTIFCFLSIFQIIVYDCLNN